MDITRTPQTAYCYANGEIIWARTEPPDAIPIIPELYSRKSYLDALILFEARVRLYCEQKRI